MARNRSKLSAHGPQSRKSPLFSPCVRENRKYLAFLTLAALIQRKTAELFRGGGKLALKPWGDCTSIMARKTRISGYLINEARKRVSEVDLMSGKYPLSFLERRCAERIQSRPNCCGDRANVAPLLQQ